MPEMESVAKVSGTAAKGVAREQAERVKGAVDASSEAFRREAAEMVESAAQQVRQLGRRSERHDQAHVVARRLERTADYLRYRPAAEVVEDTWEMMKRYHLPWIAGGLAAGLVAYAVIKRQLGASD